MYSRLETFLSSVSLLHMTPSVSKHISFALWDECNRFKFIIQRIPRNICNIFSIADVGIFEKMQQNFKEQVKKE